MCLDLDLIIYLVLFYFYSFSTISRWGELQPLVPLQVKPLEVWLMMNFIYPLMNVLRFYFVVMFIFYLISSLFIFIADILIWIILHIGPVADHVADRYFDFSSIWLGVHWLNCLLITEGEQNLQRRSKGFVTGCYQICLWIM